MKGGARGRRPEPASEPPAMHPSLPALTSLATLATLANLATLHYVDATFVEPFKSPCPSTNSNSTAIFSGGSSCSLSCAVSARLCRACCAKLGLGVDPVAATTPASAVTAPSQEVIDKDTSDSRLEAARLIAQCTTFTTGRVVEILRSGDETAAASLAAELKRVAEPPAGATWEDILTSRRAGSTLRTVREKIIPSKC